MDLELIRQADRTLSKCGARPIVESGSVVCIEKVFLMPLTLSPGQSQNFIKEITGDTIWELRAISCDQGQASIVGARLQVQLPSGRFLLGGNGIDAGQFAWVGSYPFVVDPPEECQPGATIEVSLSDYTGLGSAIATNLYFEGAYKYFLKGGQMVPYLSATAIPRYQKIVNENILAPCWYQGVGPRTPRGYKDDRFTYSSTRVTVPLAGPLSTTLKIPIDATTDFVCRRLLFDVDQDAGVTGGEFLGRVRAGTGYALIDNYIDLARYLGGAELAKDWIIRAGDSVFVDVVLADGAGSGNMYLQVHLEGARRKRL